jgi:hypothetical protein
MRKELNLNIFLLGFIVLALCASSFSKDIIVESKWVASPMKIDGLNNDWDNNALNSEGKIDVDYAFMNDAGNLYILFIFKNPKFLSSIGMTGMTIWFDSEANKKKDYGIRFIGKQISADQYISMLEEKMGAVPEAKKAQIRTNPRYNFYDYELINKISKSPSKFSEAQDPIIPAFRNSIQQKTVIYEFLIPLKRLAELSKEIGANPGKAVQVCFEWGGATKELERAAAGQISSQATRATGESGMGGLKSERDTSAEKVLGDVESGSELAAMRKRIPQQYSFWVEVKLAQNQ